MISGYLTDWDALCAEEIKGTVVIPVVTNRQMRSINFTNVFHSITTNGYWLVNFDNIGKCRNNFLHVQKAEYSLKDKSNIRFLVEYVTTSDKTIGGLISLASLTDFYSNRSGKLFQQYNAGPGDICLVDIFDITAINTNPQTVKTIFFSRDNVAVRVRNLHGGDILAFAKLLDACILASPAPEPAQPPEKTGNKEK